jgi:hypothetical protein
MAATLLALQKTLQLIVTVQALMTLSLAATLHPPLLPTTTTTTTATDSACKIVEDTAIAMAATWHALSLTVQVLLLTLLLHCVALPTNV